MTIQTRWRAQVEGRKARQHFKKMLKHKNALIDMFIYLVFCGLILIVAAYRATYFEIYDMKKLMTDLIVDEEFYVEDTHIYKSMMDVATEEELWQYLRGPFVGNLFPEDCYSKQDSRSRCQRTWRKKSKNKTTIITNFWDRESTIDEIKRERRT